MSAQALLAAIEARTREHVRVLLAGLTRTYSDALLATIGVDAHLDGARLVSHSHTHAVLGAALAHTAQAVQAVIEAGAHAGAALAAREHPGAPTGPDVWGHSLAGVLADLSAGFAQAGQDITAAVIAAHDGASDPHTRTTPAVADQHAVEHAVRRLGVRAGAGAATAVHRAYTDTQLAGAAGQPTWSRWRKRWHTTSARPCPACAGLHGNVVDLHASFDPHANTDPSFTPPPVYRDLLGPPRHPYCRCRITITATDTTTALDATLHRSTPTPYRWLSADAVRRLPETQYQALTVFLDAVLARIRELLRQARDGH